MHVSGLMGLSCGFKANELSGTTAKQLVFLRASSAAARAGAARAAAAGTVFNIVRRATGSNAVAAASTATRRFIIDEHAALLERGTCLELLETYGDCSNSSRDKARVT